MRSSIQNRPVESRLGAGTTGKICTVLSSLLLWSPGHSSNGQLFGPQKRKPGNQNGRELMIGIMPLPRNFAVLPVIREQLPTITMCLVSPARIPLNAFEPRILRNLALFDPTEECPKCQCDSLRCDLKGLRVEGGEPGAISPLCSDFFAHTREIQGRLTCIVSAAMLFQKGVIQAAAVQGKVPSKKGFLCCRRVKTIGDFALHFIHTLPLYFCCHGKARYKSLISLCLQPQ